MNNKITDILLGFEVDSCIIAGVGISQDDLTKQVEGKKFKYFVKKKLQNLIFKIQSI